MKSVYEQAREYHWQENRGDIDIDRTVEIFAAGWAARQREVVQLIGLLYNGDAAEWDKFAAGDKQAEKNLFESYASDDEYDPEREAYYKDMARELDDETIRKARMKVQGHDTEYESDFERDDWGETNR